MAVGAIMKLPIDANMFSFAQMFTVFCTVRVPDRMGDAMTHSQPAKMAAHKKGVGLARASASHAGGQRLNGR
jgi:hypothetical protein